MALPKNIPSGKTGRKRRIPALPNIDNEVNDKAPEEKTSFAPLDSNEMQREEAIEKREDDELQELIRRKEAQLKAEYDKEQEELRLEREQRARVKARENGPQIEDPFAGDTDEEKEFIDRENLMIEPIGGKKSNKKNKKGKTAKAKDFDDRKNKLALVKILRIFILVVIIGLFLLGLKNTFFPSHVYTKEDITNISQRAVGQTGFPMAKGRAFAEQFTEAYFTIDSGDDNARRTLDYFYGGRGEATTAEVAWSGANKQKILVQPKVYSEQAISENISYYYVNTLVSDREGNSIDESGKVSSKWVALAVTVYYNPKTQELSIAKDSPQLIPSFEISSGAQLPPGTPLGTGSSNAELYDAMKSTINGYVKAYAASTTKSHGDADQYVKDGSDPSVFAGFGGSVTVDTDQLSSQTVAVYPSSDSPDNNEWKVDMNIQWKDATSTSLQDQLTYKGRYVMTIEKNNDGKYFVTAFRPYIYTPKEEVAE